MVRNIEDGKLVKLEPRKHEEGRWTVEADAVSQLLVAAYKPETRGEYQAHDLPCVQRGARRGRLVLGTMQEGLVHA